MSVNTSPGQENIKWSGRQEAANSFECATKYQNICGNIGGKTVGKDPYVYIKHCHYNSYAILIHITLIFFTFEMKLMEGFPLLPSQVNCTDVKKS